MADGKEIGSTNCVGDQAQLVECTAGTPCICQGGKEEVQSFLQLENQSAFQASHIEMPELSPEERIVACVAEHSLAIDDYSVMMATST